MKNGFTIIEVLIVFILILGVTFLVLPKSLDSTKQAKFISQWSEKYNELQYMFSAIKAQKDSELKRDFKQAQNDAQRKKILVEVIKPYLRIKSEIKPDGYNQLYMNKCLVERTDRYNFQSFYITESGEILGLKMLQNKCTLETPCAVMSIDLNGKELPNTWGYDIYGINIFENRIEPIGKGEDSSVLRKDCSKKGFGIYCSYYYLIGGKFD